MKRTRNVLLRGILSGAGIGLLLSLAHPAEAHFPPTLDEELLKDLDMLPLDGADRELLWPAQQPGDRGPRTKDAQDDLPSRLQRELGAAAEPEDGQPLLAIARRMRQVEDRIAKQDAGGATQTLQQQIVADLDDLIRQARKRCQQCQSGSCQSAGSRPGTGGQPKPQGVPGKNNPGSPPATTANSQPDKTPGRQPNAESMQEVRKKFWGMLPPSQRDAILQLPADEFLPKYQSLIEEYFRRLSEEDAGSDAASGQP